MFCQSISQSHDRAESKPETSSLLFGRSGRRAPDSQTERGVALIAVLLILLLLSAAGAAIMLISGGESSLVGNQRSYSLVWDAAVGGLEEARSRLSASDPSFIGVAGPPPAITFPAVAGDILYILNNPGGSFTVSDITNSTSQYYDWEYDQEWGSGKLASANSAGKIHTLSSDTLLASLSGKLAPSPYAWVRVTILTEQAAGRDINGDSTIDATIPVFFDLASNHENVMSTSPRPGNTVYRLTSLAVLSNGASSMVQYDAGPGAPIPPLPAALTLCGPNVTWSPPHSNNWGFYGQDQATPPQPPVEGIATCNATANNTISSNLPKPNNYQGKSNLTGNDVVNTSATMNSCLQSVTCLDTLVQSLTAAADQVFTAPSMPTSPWGTDANPLITVVQDKTSPSWQAGDLSGCQGAGILVVTGTLTCSGGSSFDGLILVIGQGNFQINGGGSGAFNGGFLVAKTRDSSRNLLATLGQPSFGVNGGGANSMTYNSAFISKALNRFAYRVIAFREINK